ncbi:MAG: response regulator transcription factor [Planctomycetota bacterium]|jgi:two-component system response regulator FixJ
MSNYEGQTVFVIDDDRAVRESIAALLDIRGLHVETFASGEEFLSRFTEDISGCVVTDLRIEDGMTGLDLQVALQDRGFRIPVIVISAYANVSNAVQAMHHGAVTLLEKNCSTETLWQAISDALDKDRETRDATQHVDSLLDRFRQLTDDEMRVLHRIVEGTLNKVIAKELGISLRTVESRRQRVLAKVGVTSVPELVRAYVELEQALGRPPIEALISDADKTDQ